jgi:hypothetical protein
MLDGRRFLLSMLSRGGNSISGAVAIGPAFVDQAVTDGRLSSKYIVSRPDRIFTSSTASISFAGL